MTPAQFTTLVTGLPEADLGLPGVRAWLLSGDGRQIAFFDIEPIGAIPEHAHEEQWGVVVEGETRRCRAGDSYHIPAGTPHAATFLTRFRAVDVFGNPQRYRAKVAPTGLAEVRGAIDRIDQELVRLIAERGRWVEAAAGFKRTEEEARAPARVEQVLVQVRQHAATTGASREVVDATFRAMIAAFIELERARIRGA
jgi:chorismate mutase